MSKEPFSICSYIQSPIIVEGHSHLNVTEIYLHSQFDNRIKAVQSLNTKTISRPKISDGDLIRLLLGYYQIGPPEF